MPPYRTAATGRAQPPSVRPRADNVMPPRADNVMPPRADNVMPPCHQRLPGALAVARLHPPRVRPHHDASCFAVLTHCIHRRRSEPPGSRLSEVLADREGTLRRVDEARPTLARASACLSGTGGSDGSACSWTAGWPPGHRPQRLMRTFKALVCAAFLKVSYADMRSSSAKRCVTNFSTGSFPCATSLRRWSPTPARCLARRPQESRPLELGPRWRSTRSGRRRSRPPP